MITVPAGSTPESGSSVPRQLATGLRTREHDASLPARAGDRGLSPPSEETLRRQLRALLLEHDAPEIVLIDWELARWKPGVSLTCTYHLHFADGSDRIVVWKRGRKVVELAERSWPATRDAGDRPPLRPFGVDAREGVVLWTFPSDRQLRGLPRALDASRMARRLEELGLAPSNTLDRHAARSTLLRYKPERRAVLRLDAPGLAGGSQRSLRVALRVLPAEAARRIVHTRRALDFQGAPRLLAGEEEKGILIEQWLEMTPLAPNDFARSAEAGIALALLHCQPPVNLPGRAPLALAEQTAALFASDSVLVRLARGLQPASTSGPTGWAHGDFHPDQLALDPSSGACRLLDLDELHLGDTSADLASWIADALIEGEESLEAAAEPLLAGYITGGAVPPSLNTLRVGVARELVVRAAGTLRRLEVGAIARARDWLGLARRIAPRGEVFA